MRRNRLRAEVLMAGCMHSSQETFASVDFGFIFQATTLWAQNSFKSLWPGFSVCSVAGSAPNVRSHRRGLPCVTFRVGEALAPKVLSGAPSYRTLSSVRLMDTIVACDVCLAPFSEHPRAFAKTCRAAESRRGLGRLKPGFRRLARSPVRRKLGRLP